MSLATTAIVLVIALAIDARFGYPDKLFQAIGHPVTWIGRAISFVDRRMNNDELSFDARKQAGVSAIIAIIAGAALIGWLLQKSLSAYGAGLLTVPVIASAFIASRSLYDHVSDVAEAMETKTLQEARGAVSKIVGRDPEQLNEHGIARAAIESLAENASDGIVAPVLWFLVLGLPGLFAYKAINTADSMIGHLTPRHEAFGWAAAKTDDVVNLPASRLTGLLFALAALRLPNASPREAIRAMLRDAKKHRSPNAGWPESAMAGALGFKLAGPRAYHGKTVDDAYIGDGTADLSAADINKALELAKTAWFVMVGLIAAVALIALI